MTVERTRPSSTAVVLLDIQDGPASAIAAERLAQVERAAGILVHAAVELRAPLIVTEQDPARLGATWARLAEPLRLAGVTPLEKLTFSACNEPAFVAELKASGADAALVLGIEAHIGVFQTVRDLVARGLRVDVPVDGVASRLEDHRQIGLHLCEKAGATLTTAETVVFDWLVQAGTESFRKLEPTLR